MEQNYTSIRLEITSHCNLKCEYCHNLQYSNRADDLTTAEIIAFVENMKKTYNIKKVLLTGGEPLTKKDICHIISAITKMGIKVDMVTNGTLLTLEKLKALEGAGLKRIRISIDDLSSNTEIRDNSNSIDLWKIAKSVVENTGIELCIHTVCSPYNVQNLYDVYKQVLDIGAARWRVFDLGYQGGSVSKKEKFDLESYYNDLILSTKKILADYIENDRKKVLEMEINNIFRTAFLDMNSSDYEDFDISVALEKRMELSPCNYIVSHQISVRSDGTGTLCQYFHNPIFDYKKWNFDISKAIEKQTKYAENEIAMKDLKYCSKCKYCLVCNSGCRSRAEFLTGDILDADPGACYLHKLVHKEIMTMLPSEIFHIYEGYINPNGLEPKYDYDDFKIFLRKRGYNA